MLPSATIQTKENVSHVAFKDTHTLTIRTAVLQVGLGYQMMPAGEAFFCKPHVLPDTQPTVPEH